MNADLSLPRVDGVEVHVRCPSLAPGAYLAWASWWHTVNSSLLELALDADGRDVEVAEQVGFWERLLAHLERELPHVVFGTDSIAPLMCTTRREASDAARVARSRLAWLRNADLLMLRPDADVARSMEALITALDAEAEPRAGAKHDLAVLADR